MNTPLLQSKLYIQPPRPKRVSRPHLIERLNAGLGHKLTLISAPAGFGKTTLISDWLHQNKVPAAWLSLDEEDNDLTRFLVYLIAALQTLGLKDAATIGDGVLTALQSPQPPPIESTLTVLLNDITAIPDQVVLVLDDYHLIDAEPVSQALTFLLEHLPPQLHLAITTREDPPLPLARLRARGQLTELRAADLRFTPAEATQFLNQVMGLNLTTEEITALEIRTEGWVAGLQMAAISMQGRTDTAGFIQAFTGSHRFIIDYLAEEVLQRQTEQIRNFLVQTAILNRLSGPLCDTLTGGENGSAVLETLERGNLFVVPLDDRRQWYRYHHLFADVLRAHLLKRPAAQVSILHKQASTWYDDHHYPAEAIHHALAARDFERGADLIELAWPAIFKGFQPAAWLGWVRTLPDDLVRARPVLSVGYAWTLLDTGELMGVEARLQDAERWLDVTADLTERPRPQTDETHPEFVEGRDQKMVVVNEAEFRTLPATIAMGRAYLARALGDVPAIIKNARRALDHLPPQDHYWRGIAAMFLGLAYRTNGDLAAAYQSFADSVESLQQAGHIHFRITGTVTMADIRVAQGRLNEAVRLYEQALQLVSEHGQSALQGTAGLYIGLGELHRERGDLAAATQFLLRGQELAEQAMSPASDYRLSVALARLKAAEGDLDGALDLLDRAEQMYNQHPLPEASSPTALKARLWLRQGRLAEALAWVRAQNLSAGDGLSAGKAFEYITLARILIARYQHEQVDQVIHEAVDLLARLLQGAETAGRAGSVIEILIPQALAYQTQGNTSAALAALDRALTLAEPEGYIRIFADEGSPMQTLLAASLARGATPAAYITQLLAAINQQLGDQTTTPDPNQRLIEPLSKRELEVLRLMATGLTNQAIADELIIALSTVKKHVNNIFGKLGVGRRTQAVSRARDLDLL